MKLRLSILIVGVLVSQLGWASGKEVKIGVNGMVCGFCAQGITKKFKAEAPIEAVDVKLSDKQVKLILKDKQEMSDERIKEILKDAGYTVEKIERSPASTN